MQNVDSAQQASSQGDAPAHHLVVVGSSNPVKAASVAAAWAQAFPELEVTVEALSVPSGVADQPMSDEETRIGARQRAEACRTARGDASYWVGLEGGVDRFDGDLGSFAWAVVLSRDSRGRDTRGWARSGTFFLPPAVRDLVLQGVELGEADDIVFGRTGSKKNEGAVGLLTGGRIDRRSLYEHALVLALIPFLPAWQSARAAGPSEGRAR